MTTINPSYCSCIWPNLAIERGRHGAPHCRNHGLVDLHLFGTILGAVKCWGDGKVGPFGGASHSE